MAKINFPFSFLEDSQNQTVGNLELEDAIPYQDDPVRTALYRPGKIKLTNGKTLDLVLYHNDATAKFIYLRNSPIDKNLLDIVGLSPEVSPDHPVIKLPGQLCLGSDRVRLISDAIDVMVKSPVFSTIFDNFKQQNIAVFPIAREGLKYQVLEAIYKNYGFYCDEIVLDAHHVFDSSVPVYNRTVELTLFKDKDLDLQQKENISVAFFADSIASGLVMKEVIERVKERFENLKQVEVIAPLATIRGLCRIVQTELSDSFKVRAHVFETLLNALPPDYYYSAHFSDPKFHICPDLDQEYREWWGTSPLTHDSSR